MKPFVENFAEIRKRFAAWWEGRLVDRVLLYVSGQTGPAAPHHSLGCRLRPFEIE